MIILNNNNTNVNIPDYDDLVNKPSINGVVLEGNKTTAELGIDIDTTNFYTKREVNERIADSITGIESEFGNYYTKSQSDSKYQPKGNYLTSIPSEYITETELTNKGYATTTQLNSKQNTLVSGTNIKTINGQSLLGSGNITIESGTTIPTMFIPKGYSGSVDLSILTPIYDAVMNNKPWIVWGDLGAANGRYNMVECSTIGDNTITFYDNSVASDNSISIIRYWTFNITDGTFVMEERNIAFATTTQLNSKQDTLVSGENIKTVNGISLLGGGNITIENVEPDLTGYATETYVSDNYQPKGNYLTSVPSEYVTETELTNKGYATTTQLNSKQDTLVSGTNIKTINGISLLGDGNIVITGSGEGGSVDLSDYYTKGEVDGLISNLDTSVAENYYTIQEVDELVENVEPDLTGYATETYVSDNYQPKGNYLTSVPSEYITESELSGKNYATTSYVDTQIGNINTILENILN